MALILEGFLMETASQAWFGKCAEQSQYPVPKIEYFVSWVF